jgi:hypothetical protein
MGCWRPAVAATIVVGLAVSCGGSPSAPGAPAGESPTEKLATAHFRILADRADAATLRAIADSLEATYPRMTAALGSGEVTGVSAWVWTDSAAFYEAQRRNIGQSYPGTTGYVFPTRNIALLVVPAVASNATHEFAHLVSLAVNPRISNNPRWLWETVALYENGEFVAPMTLDYIRAGRYPTLAQLNAEITSNHQVYEVGYVLGEFIVETWGPDGLIRLVQLSGDVAVAFGVSVAEFESRWYGFLRAKYGTP